MSPTASPAIPALKAKPRGEAGADHRHRHDQSIAWGCAKAFRALGAELAVTYLNDKARKLMVTMETMIRCPT